MHERISELATPWSPLDVRPETRKLVTRPFQDKYFQLLHINLEKTTANAFNLADLTECADHFFEPPAALSASDFYRRWESDHAVPTKSSQPGRLFPSLGRLNLSQLRHNLLYK